ncbi:MAG: hypothetical protein ACFBSD_12105 [Paracoccaceae bacterium]
MSFDVPTGVMIAGLLFGVLLVADRLAATYPALGELARVLGS